MSWVIVADAETWTPDTPMVRRRLTPLAYLKAPVGRRSAKVLNLAASTDYQSAGYYVSLLAEARGDKVLPTTTTLLELASRRGHAYAVPRLEERLNRRLARRSDLPAGSVRLTVCMGRTLDRRFQSFARDLFDWFRAPLLKATVTCKDGIWRIARLVLGRLEQLTKAERVLFTSVLAVDGRAPFKVAAGRTAPRWSLAVLFDPKDPLPPSTLESLDRMARVMLREGIAAHRIGAHELERLAEFDALFIRQTTSVADVTFRFAAQAAAEGIPVIDDPQSIIRCTNKVYLAELLRAHGVPTPATRILSAPEDIAAATAELGLPLVLKIPDGSFSRGVLKAADAGEAEAIARELFQKSELILAQTFTPTSFDWRVGVLDGEPLFVSQYMMARKHWQIVHHQRGRPARQGGFKTLSIEHAPPSVIETAVRAARLMGEGLYGVDLKETTTGVVVIEVNDNPNVDHDVEGAILKDALWQRLARWYLKRLEARSVP